MSAYTLSEAQAELAVWKAALTAIAGGQSYTIAGRSLSRANLPEVKDMVEYFGIQVDSLTRGHRAVYNVLPVDC